MLSKIISLHQEARRLIEVIKANEAKLILTLVQIDELKVYKSYKYPSLFRYLTLSLGFSEHKAYSLILVVRAVRKVPKLGKALQSGEITVSKARRIAPVLDEENLSEWIKRGKLLSHRQLEKLVASQNPESVEIESYHYVSEKQIEVKITLTEEEFLNLKRAQSLLCQKEKKNQSLRRALVTSVNDYVNKHDPVKKALRNQKRKELGTCQVPRTKEAKPNERPIYAPLLHQVNERDLGQCQALMPNGEKCLQDKWIHVHHIQPVSHGGKNNLDNLITLCSGHHSLEHGDSNMTRDWGVGTTQQINFTPDTGDLSD